MKKIAIILFVFFMAASVWATTLTCSIDDMSLFWTGKTRVDQATAQMLFQHKCINEHYYWLTSKQMYE